MANPNGTRLLHAIVAMGVALTGGSVACGGSTGTGTEDAAVDGPYHGISIDTGTGDTYAQIRYPGDTYVGISIDATPPPDSGTDSYQHISIDTGVGDAPADCYPCIAPNPG